MASQPNIDGVLVTWGDRLFYPGNRKVKGSEAMRLRASAIRRRIEATVVRRAQQVVVKLTGGGRGMRAIAAHFRYISKNGEREMEDQRGETLRGRSCVRELVGEWRVSGSLIPEAGEPWHRREAFNIMLSMPRGTDPLSVQRAAREFARVELDGHKYVMVLHDHQANPHVHISVRAESITGRRLNPRKEDLHRWRETFAEKLRGYGIDAEATRQATRLQRRVPQPLWRTKARIDGRLRSKGRTHNELSGSRAQRGGAVTAWENLREALSTSSDAADRDLGRAIESYGERDMTDMTRHRAERARGNGLTVPHRGLQW